MFKATIISTIFAAAVLPAAAEPGNKYDLSILPTDVSERVTELLKYGDRFEPAIRAILSEATKPTWSFDGCAHEATDHVIAMSQT